MWWVVFLQTLVYLINFFLNVYFFPNVKTDCLYIYYAHHIGYSSGFLKVNLGNMMCILKFKLFGLDIWKDCRHLIFISLNKGLKTNGMYMVLCDVYI